MKYKQLQLQEKISTDKIDPNRLINVRDEGGYGSSEIDGLLTQSRSEGAFGGKAIWLNDDEVDWVLGFDKDDNLCLVPLKKKN